MGHNVGKDIYQKLGKKIDGSTIRTPMNKQLFAILKELYSHEEAELIVKMPYSLSSFKRIQRETGVDKAKLEALLKSLCVKGLVMDIKAKNKFLYIISPLAVGIFEYTMMRTGKGLNTKKWAHLFHEYMQMPGGFYDANFGHNEKISIMRTLPHEETILPSEFVEILDYEKAPKVDKDICLGCGVCSLNCSTEAIKLTKRKKRVIHPENTYERVILQSLERGNLQNFIFDNPNKSSHNFMRAVLGGFLRLSPAKKGLMSYALNSDFLHNLTNKKQ